MCLTLGAPFTSVLSFHPIRLQKEGSDDSTPPSERLGVHVKGEDERVSVHVKGESTESELEEEDEDDDVIQLREGDEEERGGYSQVCEHSGTLHPFCTRSVREGRGSSDWVVRCAARCWLEVHGQPQHGVVPQRDESHERITDRPPAALLRSSGGSALAL